MLFNSFHFLLFFPVVTLVYFALPAKRAFSHTLRRVWLLVCSYYFYMSWNPRYALLMAASTLITYASGLLIDRSNKVPDEAKRTRQKKLWVACSFTSSLLILFLFKYFDFTLVNVNRVLAALHIQVLQPSFDWLLPVGISFYTFQALSYTMDVYRGDIYAERNVARYALFVSFFPQLVAGPIERSKNLLVQINEKHAFDAGRVIDGLLLMMWGYFQKLIIADRAAALVDAVYDHYGDYTGVQIAVATALFAVQIYCDFAGYSNIAVGAAQVLGFRLMENFRRPYLATSVQDFWRRWHISLSTWFRDYLYIPLGGSRGTKQKKYRNVMITFLVSGLWHGASWNYVLWGGLHGAYQVLGDMLRPVKEKLYKKLRINTRPFSFKLGQALVTFFLVTFAWIFFRAPGGAAAFAIIRQMAAGFHLRDLTQLSSYTLGADGGDFAVLVFGILVLLVVDILAPRFEIRPALARQNTVFRWVVYYAAVLFLLFYGVIFLDNGAAQFIYFQF